MVRRLVAIIAAAIRRVEYAALLAAATLTRWLIRDIHAAEGDKGDGARALRQLRYADGATLADTEYHRLKAAAAIRATRITPPNTPTSTHTTILKVGVVARRHNEGHNIR